MNRCLIVIDVQESFRHRPYFSSADVPGFLAAQNELIAQAQACAMPIVRVLHCDLVVASTAARFGMSLAQVGLAPSWFLAKKILEVANPVIAKRILLLGDPLPASEFHALGLISHVASPAELESAAAKVIQRLVENAPLSLVAMKALITREMAFRDQIPHEDVDLIIDKARTSQDAQEGMKARLEKRKASFKGR